jgi:phospholipase D1/2
MAAESISLFEPGRNCYQVARARRAALLIDAEAYFRAFAHAALHARSSIVLLGWDFHSQTRLHLNLAGVPDLLGDFLNFLLRRNRRLRIFILAWDYPLMFGQGREPPVGADGGWQPHSRIRFHYDSNCPLGAALHQKIVVIDGAVAFCGGIDLTIGRWDTPAHTSGDPRRTNLGEIESYGPVHDTMLSVDSGAAYALLDIAQQRWFAATGRPLPVFSSVRDAWPESVAPMFYDVNVGVARTVPPRESGRAAVIEVEKLYLDMIAAARRYIYIENQYFTAKAPGDALAVRLAEADGPEVIVVARLSSHGWLEAPAMAALRTVLMRKLRAADTHGRLQVWYPESHGECCDVHSKLMLVDDRWLRVGSANFANRSMGLDTECDLVIEAGEDGVARSAMAATRNALLGEHLGVAPHDIENALEVTGSLGAAVASLAKSSGRTLRVLEEGTEPSSAVLALANGVADPECPVSMQELIAGRNAHAPDSSGHERNVSPVAGRAHSLLGGTVLGILLGVLIAMWFVRQLAPGVRASIDVVWLLAVTFAATAAARWIIRGRSQTNRNTTDRETGRARES